MKILGIQRGHTSTASLMDDGEVIGCVSEERFTHVKNQGNYPKLSIEYLLKEHNIDPDDIDEVAISGMYSVMNAVSPNLNEPDLLIKILSGIYGPFYFFRRMFGRLTYKSDFFKKLRMWSFKKILKLSSGHGIKKERESVAEIVGVSIDKVKNYDHHLCHAASAYYASPYNKEKALVLTLDGEGDFICASVNIFDGENYEVISTTPRSDSIGLIYMYLTGYLGMKMNEHEYKVMGLAPYAKPYAVEKVYKKIQDLVTLDPEDKFKFKSKIHTSETPFYLAKNLKGDRFDNIAAAFQLLLENVVVEWVREAVSRTGIKTVCVSGGVFMNVKMNKKVMEIEEIEKIFVMPSSGDESLPIGACYLSTILKNKEKKNKIAVKPLRDLYLGPSYNNEYVSNFIKKYKLENKYRVEYFEDIEIKIAELLKDKKVVARMSGRMEWGARALGNRSILANPSEIDVVKDINEQMKDRDFWMPFTPSVLDERMSDYVINPKKIFAPYMILAFDSTLKAQKDILSALHPYDYTARPQQVLEEWNPKYYKIIKEFEKITGIGGVLNTSFNLHGLPIVLGPEEAMHAFENSGIQYLAMENYLVSKEI